MKSILSSVALFFLICQTSLATTYYWIGGASLKWSNSQNWSLTSGGSPASFAPVQNDVVIFNKGGNVTVEYDVSTHDIGFADFKVLNNTQLTLINIIALNSGTFRRSFTINNGQSSSYFEVVEAGSSLTLSSNSNTTFSLGSFLSSGRMVFNGPVKCMINDAINTSYGPRLDASDSIIVNNLFYIGTSNTPNGINPLNNKFRFGPNGIYQIDKDGGIFVYGKWESGSLIRVTGTKTTFPSYWNGIYQVNDLLGGIEIDVPNANIASPSPINIPARYGIIFQNDFVIKNLGNAAGIIICNVPNMTIRGNLEINDGKVQWGNDASVLGTTIIEGTLRVDSGTTLDLQRAAAPVNLKLNGNAIINGIITESGSSIYSQIEFSGNSLQEVTANGSIEENISLVINNSAGVNSLTDLKLGGGIASLLKLQNGNLNATINDKTIFVRNNLYDAIQGGTISSHIIGKLSRASAYKNSYSFPVSDNASDLAMAVINMSSNTPGNWTVAFKRPNTNSNATFPAGVNAASDYVWNIDRESQTQATEADNFVLKYATIAANGIIDSNNTKILRWDSNQWTSLGGLPDSSGGIRSINNPVTNFGIFCFGKFITIINTPQLNSETVSLNDYGEVCIGTTSGAKSFILTGNYLNAGNVQIGPANGFRFSTSSNGPFLDFISLNQAGGKLDSTTIWVVFNPESAGNFNVALPVGGAGADTIFISASGKGIDNSSCNSKPFIYPNPNNGAFYVNLPLFDNSADRTVVIYDSKGARVYSQKFNQQLMYVNCPYVSNGVYHIKVFDKFGNKLKSGKLNIIR
jgi:hypothetical protein